MAKAKQDDINDRYQVPALARGLKIMELIASRPQGCTVSEVVAELDLPKPSAFRMVNTLHEQGYIKKDESNASYRISRKLLSLGYASVDTQGIIEKSMDILRKLRDATNETALIAVLSGAEGIVMEQAASPQAVKVLVQIGHRFPLHTAAPGKAILAFLPEDEQSKLLDSLTYEKFTLQTITSRKKMLAELKKVNKEGVAYDQGEELEDLRCASAPVLDARGYPLAAIWVSGPSSRIDNKKLESFAPVVAQHAKMISERFSI